MKTEELENKLKITENTAIHCPTLELAKQVLSIFHKLGLKWCSKKHYTLNHNWDKHKENTVYYPFDGEFSSLEFANLLGCKIISAEKFIALHTEAKEFDLENYVPKGHLEGFPKEIIARMLECLAEQGNKRDISVLEEDRFSLLVEGGFDWDKTKEGYNFWYKVIIEKNFDVFFEKYPKEEIKLAQNAIKQQNKMTKEELENYEPKGELIGFPKEVIKRILDCQEEQSNKRDVSVFEKNREATMYNGGFDWNLSKEGQYFWHEVIQYKNFDIFFEKYPKQDNQELKTAKYVQVGNNAILSDYTSTQSSVEINITEDNSQEFRVEDKVYDILLKEVGVVQDITYSSNIPYGLSVEFKSGVKSYTTNGCYIPEYKNPHLLHYRDDYNYDVIDFNNLPKHQEVNRWRAEKGEIYYSFTSNFKIEGYSENNFFVNDEDYDLGNYFQTKEEAQKVADKLKEYFKQLINK